MSEPPPHPDPVAAPNGASDQRTGAFISGGTFYGPVIGAQVNPPVNLRVFLHDYMSFMQDRLARFVGRGSELAEVQQRIAELLPKGGYVTITGQAGQGKSSLIAKLVELALRERVGTDLPLAQLIERAGPETLAYHFIPFQPGPDHQVGLLRNLMARLIWKYKLSELYVATDSRPALRDYFARVLIEVAAKGGQEVIYLDGLDQIEEDASGVRDLSFLPTNPPVGIVFVLGTRPNDTLRPLELRKPHVTYWLPPLSRDDFNLILQHRGVILDTHLADRFYTAMEANALYLDLVARELAEAGALPAEQIIAQVADNPENLFSLAIERLRRPPLAWREVIKPILGLLLATREPLRVRAIRTLISQADDMVQEGLERLGGLLQRDGEGRYTLFHLKLRDYLREDKAQPAKRYVFAADEEEQWHQQLAAWAEQGSGLEAIWQDKASDSLEQERRGYARRHYISHLCLAKNWPRLWDVLDRGDYAIGKLRHDPSTHSLVLDLDLVRQQIVAITRGDIISGIDYMPRLWRYSLLMSSLISQADSYPDDLILLLAEMGRLQEAIGLAEVLTDERRKVRVLVRIGSFLGNQFEMMYAREVCFRACEVAKLIKDDENREYSLKDVVGLFAALDLWDISLEVSYLIEDDFIFGDALILILERLIVNCMLDLALKIVKSIKNDFIYNKAILLLLRSISVNSGFNDAFSIAFLIDDKFTYIQACNIVIKEMAKVFMIDAAHKKILEIIPLVYSIKEHYLRACALAILYEALMTIFKPEEAKIYLEESIKSVDLIIGVVLRDKTLLFIVESLSRFDDAIFAKKIAMLIEDSYIYEQALVFIITLFISKRMLVSSLNLAISIEDDYLSARSLEMIVMKYMENEEVDSAFDVVNLIEKTSLRIKVLKSLIGKLILMKKTKEVIEMFDLFNGGTRVSVLKLAGSMFMRIGDLEMAQYCASEAKRLGSLIIDKYSEEDVLVPIIEMLAVYGKREIARDFLDSLSDDSVKRVLLAALVRGISVNGELDVALEIVELNGDDYLYDEAVKGMVKYLVKINRDMQAFQLMDKVKTRSNNLDIFNIRALTRRSEDKINLAQNNMSEFLKRTGLIENCFDRARDLIIAGEAFARSNQEKNMFILVAEAVECLDLINASERSILIRHIVDLFVYLQNPITVLELFHDLLFKLNRRDDLIALLPGSTLLIATHPPLLQDLLDGFDWVDHILKKW